LHPDVVFDWKKIARQLAEKREECRLYRSGEQLLDFHDPALKEAEHLAAIGRELAG
jgi:hypothetical protein